MKLLTFFKKLKQINNLSPISKYFIKENSMLPFFNPDDVVLVSKLSYLFQKPKNGDTIIIRNKEGKHLIKLIKKTLKESVFVIGTNEKESVDSRSFGLISKKDIIGKVLFKIN